jgi:hypothetical protein
MMMALAITVAPLKMMKMRSGDSMGDIERIKKALHGIRDYIVRGPDWNPDWYNEVMDDIHFIQDWFTQIVEAEE